MARSHQTLDDYFNDDGPENGDLPPTSYSLLAKVCLYKAVPAADRLAAKSDRSIVIVEVPSPQWIGDVVVEVKKIWPGSVHSVFESKGRMEDPTSVLRHHAAGGGLVIITDNLANAVPKPIVYAASQRYVVSPPDRKAILSVAGKILKGRVAAAFANVDASGLDFLTLGACLIRGDEAGQAAEKIRNARRQSIADPSDENLPTLSQTHGYGEAREWAKDLALDLAQFAAGRLAWSEVDHGCLLFGPPGSGKSLFARIVAREAGVPIVTASIANYFANSNGHIEGVLRQQREVFAKASAIAPCILFIDELDALPSRDISGVNKDFWRPIITDFLLLLDSAMADRAGVVVIGATNRIADLDPAVLRPGRMDRLLYIPPPGAAELVGIMKYYLKGELDGAELMPLALARPESTGADVVAWVKAARRHARNEGRQMQFQDLADQVVGKDIRDEQSRRRFAIHEAGHAIAALALGIPINAVTIAPSGSTSGETRVDFAPNGVLTKMELEAHIILLLAGRAAEAVMAGDVSTGSGGSPNSDLGRATELLLAMRFKHGMGEMLIYRGDYPFDGLTRDDIDTELKRLHSLAVGIMISHLDAAWMIVAALLQHTTLGPQRLKEIFASSWKDPNPRPPA